MFTPGLPYPDLKPLIGAWRLQYIGDFVIATQRFNRFPQISFAAAPAVSEVDLALPKLRFRPTKKGDNGRRVMFQPHRIRAVDVVGSNVDVVYVGEGHRCPVGERIEDGHGWKFSDGVARA